jgi:hypothetical protein
MRWLAFSRAETQRCRHDSLFAVRIGSPTLGHAIGEILGVEPTVCELERFPDGELQVKVGPCMTGMCTSSSRPGLR